MEVKSRRFQVFEQGFDLEAAFIVMTGFVSQIQVCQQEKGLWVSFFQPIHCICQGQCAFNETNTAGGSHRIKSGYLAIKINEAIRGCPHHKQPVVP
jgi:Ni,Fe-hydrogenase III small subunit